VTRRKIAVIGSGVSGITVGYVLSHTDYVTLFEAASRLGGHADTHMVVPPAGPPIGVDTGFIVYNERTYPLLTQMFAELGVATQASLIGAAVRHPWSTAAVSARIRWQGVKLYLRGLRPVQRPAHLPQEGVQ
jgi:predicted NAD/FAD-binding protein